MLANNDSSGSSDKYTKRIRFLTLFYVSLFGFIFLSGGNSMLIISAFGLQTQSQPVPLGLQDVDAQQYYSPPQMGYDDRSYGGGYGSGGDYYQGNSYDNNSGTTTCPVGSNLGAGALVTDIDLCNAATPAEQCPAGTDLEGVWVTDVQAEGACDVEGVATIVCPANSNLPSALVTDIQICNLDDIELFTCETGTENAGAVVTDEQLCDAPGDENICPMRTDLAGVYAVNVPLDCDIFETCPDTSNLPGAIVTDLELCDLVTEEFKACNTCLRVGVDGVEGREDTTNLLTGINQFINNNREQGPEALCELEDRTLIDTYNEIVDDNVIGLINQYNAKSLFFNCLTGSGLPVIINLDLAVPNRDDDTGVSILLGNGDGTFDPKTDFPTGNVPEYVAVGYFNADSNLDLAVANRADADVSILLGNGDGTFDPKTDFPTGIGPVSIAVGEFN